MAQDNRDAATEPGTLAELFNQRANAGDVEGLVALYEPGAVLAAGRVVATGHDEIRAFYANLLGRKSEFPAPETLEPVRNGALSVEVARAQPDGTWLWAIDQLKIAPPRE